MMGTMFSMFSKTWNPLTDMPNLAGRVAIVTGGNQGLGYAIIKFLALAGAKVYMASRSESKAKRAIEDLYRENPKLSENNIVFLKMDLANIKQIVASAEEFLKQETRLDILVNNGACVQEGLEKTDAGFEKIMATNHIGHFVLVDRLLPLMKKTASQPGTDVRVVTISSQAQAKFVPPSQIYDFSSPASLTDTGTPHPKRWPFSPHLVRYGLSKGANVLFATELQRRLDEEGVDMISTSVDPGGVATPGNADVFYAFLLPMVRLVFAAPDKGAVTPLWAATAPEIREKKEVYGGQYFSPVCKIGTQHSDFKNERLRLDLWNTTTTEVNAFLTSNGLHPVSM